MTFVHLMSHTSGLNAGQVSHQTVERAQMRRADVASGAEAGQRSFDADPRSGTLEDEMIKLAKYPLIRSGSEWNYTSAPTCWLYGGTYFGQAFASICKGNHFGTLRHDHTDWYYPEEALGRFVLPGSIVEGKLVAARICLCVVQ